MPLFCNNIRENNFKNVLAVDSIGSRCHTHPVNGNIRNLHHCINRFQPLLELSNRVIQRHYSNINGSGSQQALLKDSLTQGPVTKM